MAEAQLLHLRCMVKMGWYRPDQFGLAEALEVKMRYFADDLPWWMRLILKELRY